MQLKIKKNRGGSNGSACLKNIKKDKKEQRRFNGSACLKNIKKIKKNRGGSMEVPA